MKKIDKLILYSFLGPFALTFFVVVFILLNIQMLKYFDDIIGKDLGWDVLGTLVFYFAIFTTPTAMPLAVLLSSLIAFGNLGEHFELTAVKSLGISLVRSLFPIFVFVILLTGVAFYANNYMVPKAALEAYSLLYDIKQKKPALDLREGTFYSAIPDVSIKVNDKLPDGQSLKGVIIYDHRNRIGNREVTIADSGKMYTILNDQYLRLELFNGYNYNEGASQSINTAGESPDNHSLSKTKFDRTQIVFDLSSFGLNRTDKKWFQGNRIMRNLKELQHDMDSLGNNVLDQDLNLLTITRNNTFQYHFKEDTVSLPENLALHKKRKDSIVAVMSNRPVSISHAASPLAHVLPAPLEIKEDSMKMVLSRVSDSLFSAKPTKHEISSALAQARLIKSQITNFGNQIQNYTTDYKVFQVQWHKILAQSLACIAMFLIGAPLGAIIKRGGLGVPVLASIIFFIIYYLLTMLGEKWAKQGIVPVPVGIWAGDAILFLVGLIFLRQARADARLFEADFYNVAWDKLKMWLRAKKLIAPAKV